VFLEKSAVPGFFALSAFPWQLCLKNLEDGLTVNEIVEMFDGLKQEQFRAVLDFAAQSLSTPAHRT
jgi:uncharacterized protein (DUF433 family)